MNKPFKYCGHCGELISRDATRDAGRWTACASCSDRAPDSSASYGPALLVLTHIVANDRVLLMKRGCEPYKGTWAPPGGFVEHGESLETAAIREVEEEVRIRLSSTQLLPHSIISIPKLNQVYHVFKVCLKEPVPAFAVPPESLEVNWFSEQEIADLDMWEPAASLDMRLLFDGTQRGRFDFVQQTDDFARVITERGEIRYVWRRQ